MSVDQLARRLLHHPPEVQHHHPMADLAHHRQVVADEHHRQAQTLLQVDQQVDDLRADGHVQRRHRLVADHQRRLQDHGAGDADPLVLAARQFVRITVEEVGIELDLLHHRPRHGLAGRVVEVRPVHLQRLGDGIADGHARVQTRQRVLEHDLQVLAGLPQGLALGLGDIAAEDGDGAGGGRNQLQHRPRQGRLARAAFSDHAQGLALAQRQVDPVHGAQLQWLRKQTAADGEPHLDPLGLQDHRRVRRHGLQRRASPAIVTVQARDRVEQGAGVGRFGRREDPVDRPFLDIGPGLHHAHPVGQASDHAHVVGDQGHGRARVALQLGHQVEDLGLDGDVQRRGRLVGDQQLGSRRHGRGDHHPLAHAA
jgi:hypothetical protein